MRLLLDDRWAPTTSEMGFIEHPLDEVAAWYARWLDGLPGHEGPKATVRALDAGLEENLAALLPLTTPIRRRYLFQSTRSGWTAFFDNGARNTDAASLSHVARELGCRAMRVVGIVDKGPKRRGAAIFELYGPTPTEFLNYVRSVAVAHDGARWQFVVAGTQQPFEEPERYAAKRIQDRFDLEMLARYTSAVGVDCFDDAFYGAAGKVVESFRIIKAVEKTSSLAEARVALAIADPPS